MNRFVLSLMAVIMSVSLYAQKKEDITLRFDEKGEFKIAQITDAHYQIGNKASDVVVELIEEIIATEKPDLFVFTGDISVDKEPITGGWKKILKPIIKAKIPYAAVLGNHDAEQETTGEEILEFVKNQKYSLTELKDYVLEIEGKADCRSILYMIDSHDYSTLDNVKGYGWITHEQVVNYRATSKRFTEANGGKPCHALAFFHIPLPEYRDAYINEKQPPVGERREKECCPQINTGMFFSMVEMGDVAACFVGHDHMNDYVAYQNNIALCYGRYSGGKTTYGAIDNGSRIITIYDGKDGFSSYIRMRGGEVIQKSEFFR